MEKKPELILEIEKIIGRSLLKATKRSHKVDNPWGGLKVYKKDQPRYGWEEEKLTGLNLAQTDLTDEKWGEIVSLDGFDKSFIKVLNLSGNKLAEFRLTEELKDIEWLNIQGNPLKFPAEQITVQGPEATLRYLKELVTQGEQEVFEIKLLIVGEGGAGKTTLWYKLQNPKHPVPHDQDVTVGISIREGWTFPHLHEAGKDFLVNLWDFGGQEIQYMTHQFFLTPKSLYVLLANGRTENANFPYWLKVIDLLGRDPKQEAPMPVLVVINKRGVKIPKLPFDQQDIDRYPELDLIKYEVDFAIDDTELKGLPDKIKELLCRQMPHLPHIYPASWVTVRDKIQELKEAEKNHMNFKEFQTLCKGNGVTDLQKMKDLSRMLHELGIILHYQDEKSIELRDFVVLNPDWAVDAVYEILKHKEVEENQGRFSRAFLARVWDDKYDFGEQSHLINLMAKDSFEVCFEASEKGEKIFIAPQLLPNEAPNYAWDDENEILMHTYHYPFMPKGLIGRLIVKLNELISSENGKKILWKKGVKLAKDTKIGPVEALIIETIDPDHGNDMIKISVIGSTAEERRFLLKRIRDEFSELHDSFRNLRHSEKIPCPCSECFKISNPHYFTLGSLERSKDKGRKLTYCDKSNEDISIQVLLDSVYPNQMRNLDRKRIRELLKKGDFDKAIGELSQCLSGENLKLLESNNIQLQSLIRSKTGGTLYSEEENVQKNKIIRNILNLCDEIEGKEMDHL